MFLVRTRLVRRKRFLSMGRNVCEPKFGGGEAPCGPVLFLPGCPQRRHGPEQCGETTNRTGTIRPSSNWNKTRTTRISVSSRNLRKNGNSAQVFSSSRGPGERLAVPMRKKATPIPAGLEIRLIRFSPGGPTNRNGRFCPNCQEPKSCEAPRDSHQPYECSQNGDNWQQSEDLNLGETAAITIRNVAKIPAWALSSWRIVGTACILNKTQMRNSAGPVTGLVLLFTPRSKRRISLLVIQAPAFHRHDQSLKTLAGVVFRRLGDFRPGFARVRS